MAPCGEELPKVRLGICAMDKKAHSRPMLHITSRLLAYGEFEVVNFGDHTILNKPIEEWPACDALLTWHSEGFPLRKAQGYVLLRKPFLVNDVFWQDMLLDRRKVYTTLVANGIPVPHHIIVSRDDSGRDPDTFLEDEEWVEMSGVRIHKPFVEKPADGEDHNVHIYYPHSMGGGVKRLFRKVDNKSSHYDALHPGTVRRDGSFIYEEFLLTAVASPCGDSVCGFDLLRSEKGKSYVCDVNGWSFVKNSNKYYDDASGILRSIILSAVAPHRLSSSPSPVLDPKRLESALQENGVPMDASEGPVAEEDEQVPGVDPREVQRSEARSDKEELRCVIAVIRHGVQKLKSPLQLQELLDITRTLLAALDAQDLKSSGMSFAGGSSDEESESALELREKLRVVRTVLEQGGHFSGVNRKVQLKPTRWTTFPQSKKSLKWGGVLTHAGRQQSEDLGRVFRVVMYPGYGAAGGGLLRLHSTYRHDLKIYSSDEGRVQTSAAAFTKGLLDLEGNSVTPILVSLVKKDASMLESFGKGAGEDIRLAKAVLYEAITGDSETEPFRAHKKTNTNATTSVNRSSSTGPEPVTAAATRAGGVSTTQAQIEDLSLASRSPSPQQQLLQQQQAQVAIARLQQRAAELLTQTQPSSLPLQAGLAPAGGSAAVGSKFGSGSDTGVAGIQPTEAPRALLMRCVQLMRLLTTQLRAMCITAKASGSSWDVKDACYSSLSQDPKKEWVLKAGKASELLGKLLCDLASMKQESLDTAASSEVPRDNSSLHGMEDDDEDDELEAGGGNADTEGHIDVEDGGYQGDNETMHRLCPDYASDINSPLRHVRTRIYFTSESHMHSLINVLRYSHHPHPPNSNAAHPLAHSNSCAGPLVPSSPAPHMATPSPTSPCPHPQLQQPQQQLQPSAHLHLQQHQQQLQPPNMQLHEQSQQQQQQQQQQPISSSVSSPAQQRFHPHSSQSAAAAGGGGGGGGGSPAGVDGGVSCGHRTGGSQPLLSDEACALLDSIPELDYLTHVVMRMYESKVVPVDHPERFRVEILFSPGSAYSPFEVVSRSHNHVLPIVPRTQLNRGDALRLDQLEAQLQPFARHPASARGPVPHDYHSYADTVVMEAESRAATAGGGGGGGDGGNRRVGEALGHLSAMQPQLNEEEPQLKYEQLAGDVASVVAKDEISCLRLSDKILAVGTIKGKVHLLDYSGNQVRVLDLHSACVNDISFDTQEEHLATCSSDFSAAIFNLYTDAVVRHEHKRPIKTLAIDPHYSTRRTKEVATGGLAGQLVLSSQGWLGRSDNVLAAGEGPILSVRWSHSLIAWGLARSAAVYDTATHHKVGVLSRPPHGSHSGHARCDLVWGQNNHLYVSWPDCIKVARIVDIENSLGLRTHRLDVVTELRTTYYVMGVCPFGQDLVVLSYPSELCSDGTDPPPEPSNHSSTQPPPSVSSHPATTANPSLSQHTTAVFSASATATTPSEPAASLAIRSDTDPAGTAPAVDSTHSAPSHSSPHPTPSVGPTIPAAPAHSTPSIPSQQQACQATTHPTTAPAAWPPTTLDHVAATNAAAAPAPAAAEASGGERSVPFPQTTHIPSHASSPGGFSSSHAPGSRPSTPVPATPRPTQQPRMVPISRATPQIRIMSLTGREYRPPDLLPMPSCSNYNPSHFSFVPSLPATDTNAMPSSARGVGNSFAAAAAVAAWASGAVAASLSPLPTTAAGATSSDAQHSVAVNQASGSKHSAVAVAAGAAEAAVSGPGRHGRWDDGQGEFLYYVVAPKAILVVRTRDSIDHQWPMGRAFELLPSMAIMGLPNTYEQVVQGYIEDLLTREAYDAAAQLSPRLLKDNRALWERWVYLFAQTRQLPKLAPFIPTDSPRLRGSAYEMVLNSLLLHPSDHPKLLELVQVWPTALYSMPALVDSVSSRMKRPGGDSRQLWQLLAWLYQRQGRPDLSLSIHLQLRCPEVFTFITAHSLFAHLVGRADALLDIDQEAGIVMLTQHCDTVPPSNVVHCIQESQRQSTTASESEVWRHRLYLYLHTLFEVDPTAGAEYHELQLRLTSEYQPSKLMEFLVASQYYPLEAAHVICEEKGMVPEQVFIQGRMGNASQALQLIIHKLADIPQAIEFVRGQHDDKLWGELMDWALESADTTGALLDQIGGYIDPLSLIQRIPRGMAIPRLRDRLRVIIADFRTQTSLREGCNVILRADCTALVRRLYREVRRSVQACYVYRGEAAGGRGVWFRCQSGAMVAVSLAEVPRGGDTPAVTASLPASHSQPTQPFTALATNPPSKRAATPTTNNTAAATSAAAAMARQGNTSANTLPSAQQQQQRNVFLSQPITGFPAALLHLSQFSGNGYESEGNPSLGGATPRTNQGGQYPVSHAALQARLLAAAAADADVSGGSSGVHGMGWGSQGSGFESKPCAGSVAPAWVGFHTTRGSMDLVLMMGGGVGGEGGIYAGRRGVGGGAGAAKRKGAAAGARGGGVEVVLPSLLLSSTT
ncbi:MAG: hypothetical protein WDW38_008551 [Sanguina aurantia]